MARFLTRATCTALALVISAVSARAEARRENPEVACDHGNIELERFYAVTIDLPSKDAAAGADDPSEGGSKREALTLDIVLHQDSESITRRLNARLLGQSLTDVLGNSKSAADGLIELRRDPAIAEATKQYHDFVGPLAGPGTREVSDLALLMCNPSICKIEVGRPILLNQRPVYLFFGLHPEHLPSWKSATLALISTIGRWCNG